MIPQKFKKIKPQKTGVSEVENKDNSEKIDLIGKDIRDTHDTEPLHGIIVAQDLKGRYIVEFDDLEDECFIVDFEDKNYTMEKPEIVEQIIEHKGRKYKLLFE